MITAPYNFVPLNKEVFYPSWSNEKTTRDEAGNLKFPVHDIPFEDGESGVIDITITAKSPIYIRNHYQNGDDFYEIEKKGEEGKKEKVKVSKEFCHFVNPDGAKEFYIPGSSLKGMIRSVLEIMSFSKIRISEEHKKPLSVRDMTEDKSTGQIFNSPMVHIANGIGLLKFTKAGLATIDDYTIESKGEYGKNYAIRKIKFNQIKQVYPNFDREETYANKYKVLGTNTSININVLGKPDANRRYLAEYSHASNKQGIIVCNSYIDGPKGGKKYEFIICKDDFNETISFGKNETEKEILDNFKKVYFSEGNSETQKLGKFWKEQLTQNNPIPVFFKKSKKGKIQAIGLTQIFKLAYSKTIFDAVKQTTVPNKLDLAETIFGTEKEKLALKGRVQFSHLKSTTERYEKQVDVILGSPNPTYYPNYIRQTDVNGNKVNKYITLMDKNAEISGWKRYPLHSELMPSGESSDKEKVKTHFKPLPSETVFEGKLRFHNLKKAEIGALFSAMTFHGNHNCMHNIGMAKSLGYGKIGISLTPKNLKYTENEYLQEFETMMNSEIPGWLALTQIEELFAMANVNAKPNSNLEYQLLENPNPKEEYSTTNKHGKKIYEKNDFTGAKKAKEYLLLHSLNAPKASKNLNKTPTQKTEKELKIKTQVQNTQKDVISKTKMRKAIAEVWSKKFGIFYHPNQINEFFSKDGYKTTPPEQQKVYETYRDDTEISNIFKQIKDFNDGLMGEAKKQKLYEKLESML
jgi:CRISPR-associated protein (TIGR03986 family)